MAPNTPTTIFEALVYLRRRAVEGKDRRSLTDYDRRRLEAEESNGPCYYCKFADGVRILRDPNGEAFVDKPAWLHAMKWPFFSGAQANIEEAIDGYVRGEWSEFAQPNVKLLPVRQFLGNLQRDWHMFRQHMLDGFPSLADEWPAPTGRQTPAKADDREIPDPVENWKLADLVELKPETISKQMQQALHDAGKAVTKGQPGSARWWSHRQFRDAFPKLPNGKLKKLLGEYGLANRIGTGSNRTKPDCSK